MVCLVAYSFCIFQVGNLGYTMYKKNVSSADVAMNPAAFVNDTEGYGKTNELK